MGKYSYEVSDNTARLVHAYDTITAGIGEIMTVIEEMYGERQEEFLQEYLPSLDEFQSGVLSIVGCSIEANRGKVGSNLI